VVKDNSHNVWVGVVVHKNKILTNKEKIGNNIRKCTYVPSLPRSQQKAIRCELLKRHQPTSSNASIKSHSGRHAASSGSFPWSSRPSDNLGLNVDSSGFPHSLSPQSTYWCENASSALHCPTYNGEPAVCVLESKRCSLSLLIVLPDIITPRTYEYQLIAQQEYFTANLDIAAQKYEETGHPESFVKWPFWRIFVFHGTARVSLV
jgi:hypothetical protein